MVAFGCTPVGAPNDTVQRNFAEHRSNVEVTVDGTVTRILTDDAGTSGTHQRFIVQVAGATQTLLIDNNVDIGKRVPVAVGDRLTVHGEYVWNAEGGLVHFTHHDPQHTHEDGWIELRGVRYAVIPANKTRWCPSCLAISAELDGEGDLRAQMRATRM
jgi:hypothetical protein